VSSGDGRKRRHGDHGPRRGQGVKGAKKAAVRPLARSRAWE
jgi:hypothetical protein